MTINFVIGNDLVVNQSFVRESLSQGTISDTIKQALISLGNLGCDPAEVLAAGNLSFPTRSFIQLRPFNQKNITYHGGKELLSILILMSS